MADGGLLMIYRSLTTEKLLELQEMMLDQMMNMKDYTSMTSGQKSWTRDFRQLMSQLEGVVFVLNERGAGGKTGYDAVGVVDFRGCGSAPPAGTVEPFTHPNA